MCMPQQDQGRSNCHHQEWSAVGASSCALRPRLLISIGQLRQSGCQILQTKQQFMLQLGLLRIARGASVRTIYPMRMVLAGDNLVLVHVQPCEQETRHLISFVGLQGASLIDNEEMHGADLPGQPEMSLSKVDACLTYKDARDLGETQNGGFFGQDASFEEQLQQRLLGQHQHL